MQCTIINRSLYRMRGTRGEEFESFMSHELSPARNVVFPFKRFIPY